MVYGTKQEGGRANMQAQKLTRGSALCAVSEPETSPYCVSWRVAFVSALDGLDRFSLAGAILLCFRALILLRSPERNAQKYDGTDVCRGTRYSTLIRIVYDRACYQRIYAFYEQTPSPSSPLLSHHQNGRDQFYTFKPRRRKMGAKKVGRKRCRGAFRFMQNPFFNDLNIFVYHLGRNEQIKAKIIINECLQKNRQFGDL